MYIWWEDSLLYRLEAYEKDAMMLKKKISRWILYDWIDEHIGIEFG